jgi:hypothetical protein
MSLEDGNFPMPTQDTALGGSPESTGPGAKWFVKGGSFRFRVSSVFGLTEAYVETEDSSQRQSDGSTTLLENQAVTKMQLVPPTEGQASKLSSTPMKLSSSRAGDGIVSKLCIAIQEQDDEPGLAIETFKPSFILKNMPQTLWADPAPPPDPPITPSAENKVTIALPMAVSFSAPDPVLALSKIPQFNATDMAKECAGR